MPKAILYRLSPPAIRKFYEFPAGGSRPSPTVPRLINAGGVRHSEEAKPTKTSAAALCKRATAAGGSWRVAIRFSLQCEALRKPKACKGRSDCHALRARNDRWCTFAPGRGRVSKAPPPTACVSFMPVGEGLDPPGYFAQRRNNNCVSNSKSVIASGDPEIL